MEQKNLIEILKRIILEETKYLRHYVGKIADINDPANKGRVLVLIDGLGWSTNDNGAWCYPAGTNSVITPQINDYVIVIFMYGNPNMPYYIGMANAIQGMYPQDFDNKPSTCIIFESNDNKTYIKYDDQQKMVEIKDSNNNSIQLKLGEIDIAGTKINLLSASESFVKGDTLSAQLQTVWTAMQTFSSGLNPVTLAGQATTLNTAMGTALGILSQIKSTTIKGE